VLNEAGRTAFEGVV